MHISLLSSSFLLFSCFSSSTKKTDGCDRAQVLRDFKAPEGAKEVDANGDGEVLVVLNLEVDSELAAAGVAREVVNRFQKLRKKAGLVVTDTVEVFYAPSHASEDALAPLIESRQGTIVESLGKPLLHVSHKPK
jgi:isoleucyl-tRNA synthetase